MNLNKKRNFLKKYNKYHALARVEKIQRFTLAKTDKFASFFVQEFRMRKKKKEKKRKKMFVGERKLRLTRAMHYVGVWNKM